jgi:2-dehydro-3-deoxygluconokinase
MKKTESVFKRLRQNQLIALLTPTSMEQCVVAYENLNPLGITLEIALRSSAALSGIQELLLAHPDALVLAGTVMTARQADAAIKAGVAGIISADYIPAVVERCAESDIMCIPGGITDVGKQLAHKAQCYDCDLDELREKYPYQWIHKLFPAITDTVSFLGLPSAWKGPFKGLQLVYTGGINIQNLPSVIDNDPSGIYCGSALTKNVENPGKMQDEAQRWLKFIKSKENK